jgi:uncharacterized membrane protein
VQRRTGARLTASAWLALLAWQWVWLALLPAPSGKASWFLALAASIPLLLPLRGILAGRTSSLTWGAYLALFYAMFAVAELWSLPAQRLAALAQLVLCGVALFGVFQATRKRRG